MERVSYKHVHHKNINGRDGFKTFDTNRTFPRKTSSYLNTNIKFRYFHYFFFALMYQLGLFTSVS